MLKVFTSFFILYFSITSQADPKMGSGNSNKYGILSSINIGIRYLSLLENRGVILYRDFQIDPVVGVFMFNDRLELFGDSFGYRDFIYEDKIRFRTRLLSITDKPLFPSHDSIKSGLTERPDSFEWSNQLEFFFPGYNNNYASEIDISINKDLKAHHGIYLNLQSKIKILSFHSTLLNATAEPNLLLSLGWGDSAHNKYFYGPSAESSSLNNASYGIWFAFPELSDRYYPIIQVRHFSTLGTNSDGELAMGRNNGWLISFIATYGILE